MEKSMITKLSPPWYEYHRKVQAMFGRDPEVHIKDLLIWAMVNSAI